MPDFYIPEREDDVPWSNLTGIEMFKRLAHRATGGDPWVGTVWDKRTPRAENGGTIGMMTGGDYPEEQFDPGAPNMPAALEMFADAQPDELSGYAPSGSLGPEAFRRAAQTDEGAAGDTGDFDPREMDRLGGPGARGALEAMVAQDQGEFAPEEATPSGPARRTTPEYGGAIEKMLKAEIEPQDFWRALSRAGFTMAKTKGSFAKAVGEGGLAGLDAIRAAEDSARARQARGVGFAIQDATMAETERRNATTEGETARSHRVNEARGRDYVAVAKGNLARSQQQLNFEMAKYAEGKGDARKMTLARIAHENSGRALQDAQRKALQDYGPSYAKPQQGIDAEGFMFYADPYSDEVTYPKDREGNKIKLGAKPGATGTAKQRDAEYLKKLGMPEDEALDIVYGGKHETPTKALIAVQMLLGKMDPYGTKTEPQKQEFVDNFMRIQGFEKRNGQYVRAGASAAKPAGNPSAAIAEAKDAIKRGANKDAVKARLKEMGVDPALLD